VALSNEFINSHIQHWQESFQNSSRKYRAKWPKYLFRHEPVENAARILSSGVIQSRSGAQGIDHADIAPQGIIQNRNAAHDSVRLYFRPLNPTQFHVEGIKQDTDPKLANNAHAPILVMFVLKASSVLSLEGVEFSNGNMQRQNTQKGSSEEFFKTIDFENVYHEGAFRPEDKEVVLNARCTEVLTPSPLDLAHHLSFVFCRSEAEKRTLLFLTNQIDATLKNKIRTYSEPGVFQHTYTFVRRVDVSSTSIIIELHPRKDNSNVTINVSVKLFCQGAFQTLVRNQSIAPVSPLRLPYRFPEGSHVVEIKVDGHVAYRAISAVSELPF
jgi:hypothetical protein